MYPSFIHRITQYLARRKRRNTCLHDWTTTNAKTEIVKHCAACGAVRYIA